MAAANFRMVGGEVTCTLTLYPIPVASRMMFDLFHLMKSLLTFTLHRNTHREKPSSWHDSCKNIKVLNPWDRQFGPGLGIVPL